MIEELFDVESSHVAHASYDTINRHLTVRFHNGTTGRYSGVNPQHWQNMKHAKSIGGYLHQKIKDRHPYEKL